MILQRLPKWIWVAGLLTLAGSAGAQEQAPPPSSTGTPGAARQEPPKKLKIITINKAEVPRGSWVTFSTEGTLPTDPSEIVLYLDGRQVGTAVQIDGNDFLWQVPDCKGICRDGTQTCEKSCDECAKSKDDPACQNCRNHVSVGPHDLQVAIQREGSFVLVPVAQGADQLTIINRGGSDPRITGIFPSPSYPDNASYKISVQGEGFSENTCDNDVYLDGEQINVCWNDPGTCAAGVPQGRLTGTRKIELLNLSQTDRDFANLSIGVGNKVSESKKIRLSRVARRIPLWWSLLGFAGIVGLVLVTTSRGFKGERIAGVRYNFGSALLLDKETDTYSLSRFQFYIWTAVAILGYLYLAISRSLVQGSLDFVDIPEGLPGIVFISAGTSVLAQWTQSLRGPKGAGNVRPSFSDLITSGGVVAPERFQFFVWTVLGAVAFLALVILRDPGTISDLPRVPEGFLQLMGVSSVGYLGGKLVRKPGPVLDEVLVTSGSLVLTLRGRGLSVDAGFRIGGDEIPSMLIAEPNHKPAILEKDEQSDDPTLAKVLRLTIPEPKPEWTKEGVELTIINPDGQKAIWPCHWPMASDQPGTPPVTGGATG